MDTIIFLPLLKTVILENRIKKTDLLKWID